MPTAPSVCWVPGCLEIGCTAHRRPQRPSAHRQGYGAAWRRRRALFLAKHPRCVECGEPATQVDHIRSRRRGGNDGEDNLQALCASHHSAKTARQDGGFGR